MALTGPDGETHSHLSRNSADPQPAVDRGHWVGPRGGQHVTAAQDWANRNGLPLDPPVPSAQKPAYRESPEEVERRVDVLEKAVIRLQSVVIDLQHHVFELRK